MSAPTSTLTYDGLAGRRRPKLITELPGPEAMARIERDRKVTSPSLPRAYPFVPRRGAGSIVEDVDGNIFLDLNAGIAVTSTGHCHPKVVEAVQRQASELLHYSASDFYLPIYSDVCERLRPGGAVRRGAVVPVELGDRGGRGRDQALALRHRAAVSDRLLPVLPRALDGVGHADGLQGEVPHELGPMLPSVYHSFYGDFDYIEEVLFHGWCRRPRWRRSSSSRGWARAATCCRPRAGSGTCVSCATATGSCSCCDEVQSGIGRSGTMWAIEQEGVTPDVILSGKGIASGLPLGAMIAREDLMVWELGAHGSTYGGSPVSCAASLATFDVIEQEGLMDNAKAVGDVLLAGLRDIASRHPIITDVRGRAFWIGMTFADHDQAAAIEQASFRKGLLILGCGDADVRVSPPLVFREDQAQAALELFEEVVAEVESAS